MGIGQPYSKNVRKSCGYDTYINRSEITKSGRSLLKHTDFSERGYGDEIRYNQRSCGKSKLDIR